MLLVDSSQRAVYHIPGSQNELADALSEINYHVFLSLSTGKHDPNYHPSHPLSRHMKYLQRQALAWSTHRIYKTGWRTFRNFCDQHNITASPAAKSAVCLFATSLIRKVSLSTFRTYLAAVAYFHKSSGVANPTVGNCQLQLIIRGIRRTVAEHPHRQPISLSMLRHLCTATPQLRLSWHNRAMFVAALTLTFHGCLCVSEFIHSKYSQWNPRIRDVPHLRHLWYFSSASQRQISWLKELKW